MARHCALMIMYCKFIHYISTVFVLRSGYLLISNSIFHTVLWYSDFLTHRKLTGNEKVFICHLDVAITSCDGLQGFLSFLSILFFIYWGTLQGVDPYT